MKLQFVFVFILMLGMRVYAQEIRGVVDLHAHVASHIPYWFMLFGGDPESAVSSDLTYDHGHHQVMNLELLKKSGVKIYVQATLVNILGLTKSIAEKQVLEQLEYVGNLVKQHSADFAVAHNPAEARAIIAQGKIAFVHAFEGAEFLIDTVEDAQAWQKRGVAMIGPIHLGDNQYGDSAVMKGRLVVVNLLGWFKRTFWPSSRQGLSPLGQTAIQNMFKAGIIVDTAHMSDLSLDETLTAAKSVQLPIIMSHGYVRDIRAEERGLTNQQIKDIYSLGGMIAVTGATFMLQPHTPLTPPLPETHCDRSIDDYLLHIHHLEKQLGLNAVPIALGTDFNGFVPHFRPKYGDEGCQPVSALKRAPLPFDVQGLAGPHLLPSMFEYLEKESVGVDSYQQSGERFLQIWERVIAYGKGKGDL
ncbi:MAG: membrane dipeptidase [Bdellovibrio sp.]|nr:membrane dipeptidase [Bdellovibrio sp.]